MFYIYIFSIFEIELFFYLQLFYSRLALMNFFSNIIEINTELQTSIFSLTKGKIFNCSVFFFVASVSIISFVLKYIINLFSIDSR